jgi:hypothetical protein
MKRQAEVNARGGHLFVMSYSTTAHGTFVQGDELVEVPDGQREDGSLGRLVRDALVASRSGVPYPDFSKDPLPERRKLFKLVGVRSEKQYIQGTRVVGIYEEDENPTVTCG